MQPDEAQQRALENRRTIPLDVLYPRMNQQLIMPKLRQVPYYKRLTTANDLRKPFLLIPANPNRMGYKLCLGTVTGLNNYKVYYSFNYPPAVPFPFGFGYGITIQKGPTPNFLSDQQNTATNFTISIDDIWVTLASLQGGGGQNYIDVLGYEGVLAIEAGTLAA